MIYLTYRLDDYDYEIKLYRIEEGKETYIESFEDREDLLIYIEENYDLADLIIKG